ncbi:MAG TPA: OB-fold domain-containing protein [Negativicutes bacterium]|nr:OB-fold domain-containing protein [Negativicutes bacterium]
MLNEKGQIYTYSIIYSAAEAFKDKVPYVVAVVENSAGRRLARIEGYTDKTRVEIGMEVAFVKMDAAENPIYCF